MKKQLSKIIAMTLVCAMTLPSAVFASTAPVLSGNTVNPSVSGDISISGNGSVDTATYNLILPSNLDFAVDRFEVAGNGQIYGVDYPIANASQFPVEVKISISSNNGSASVNMVETATDSALASDSANYAVYMAAYVPSSISVASVSGGAVSSNTISGNYASISDNEAIPVTSSNNAEFSFKLDKLASVSSNVSISNCATFSWTGKVNGATEWATGDIAVDSAFTFRGLASDAYKNLESNSSNNLVSGSGGKSVTISKAAATDATFTIPSGKTLSKVTMTVSPGGTVTTLTTAYFSVSGTTFTLRSGVSKLAVGTYDLELTYSDRTTSNFTVIISN